MLKPPATVASGGRPPQRVQMEIPGPTAMARRNLPQGASAPSAASEHGQLVLDD